MLGLWPVYGLLTPIYLFVLFMGYSMALSFMPGGMIGTIIAWLLIFIIAYVSHELKHEDVNHIVNGLHEVAKSAGYDFSGNSTETATGTL